MILLILIDVSYSGFSSSDILKGPTELKDHGIYKYGYGKLIPFSNQVFGTSYIGVDKNVYAIFIKNGRFIF